MSRVIWDSSSWS